MWGGGVLDEQKRGGFIISLLLGIHTMVPRIIETFQVQKESAERFKNIMFMQNLLNTEENRK